jgi:four helix bundle protein
MENELAQRLLNFAVDVIKFSRKLPRAREYDIIKNQLIKSATSSGANYLSRQIQ